MGQRQPFCTFSAHGNNYMPPSCISVVKVRSCNNHGNNLIKSGADMEQTWTAAWWNTPCMTPIFQYPYKVRLCVPRAHQGSVGNIYMPGHCCLGFCSPCPRAWPLISGPEWNSHATCRSVMQAGTKCQAGQRGDVTLLFCASAGAQVHAASRAILGVITLETSRL